MEAAAKPPPEKDRNWIVPVGIRDRYWTARFYAGGYPTAKEAEASVRVLVEELPVVIGGKLEPGAIILGPAEECRS